MPSDPCIGQIILFAGNFAPRGWALCQGQLLPISSYQALFSILGTTYGGDGRTTFALPDLRGRAPVHAGSGPGLTTRQLGGKYGQESVTLTTSQLPSHTHTAGTTVAAQSSTVSEAASPVNRAWAPSSSGDRDYADPAATPEVMAPEALEGSTTLGGAGSGQSHTNMMPTLVLNYCIALEGVYPSRS